MDLVGSRIGVPLRQVAGIPMSVSYLALSPPSWAKISSDGPIQPRVTFVNPPASISLKSDDTCCCSDIREMFNPFGPTLEKECVIYTLLGAQKCAIFVQKCQKCRQRFIGPECSELGIFNFNNRTLFSHDLLDDYTAAFSSSETPFVAWVQTVARRYNLRGSEIPFVNEKLFRAAWFSYIRLMKLDGDMICAHCGPHPDVTIWDGVSVAFSRKNLLPSLHPPTTITSTSVERLDVRAATNLQAIPNRNTRVLMRGILKGPRLNSVDLEPGIDTNSAVFDRNRKTVERISKIPELVGTLTEMNVDLGVLFNEKFGVHAFLDNKPWPEAYQKFFLQVRLDCIQEIG